jgi:hypothetical protein
VSRGPTTFRQRDVAAAIRAAKMTGLEIRQVEIDKTGKIVIVTTKAAEAAAANNEWDSVLVQEKDED